MPMPTRKTQCIEARLQIAGSLPVVSINPLQRKRLLNPLTMPNMETPYPQHNEDLHVAFLPWQATYQAIYSHTTNSNCPLCDHPTENLDHIFLKCPNLNHSSNPHQFNWEYSTLSHAIMA